jgi:hypothetical protein
MIFRRLLLQFQRNKAVRAQASTCARVEIFENCLK